MSYCNQTTITTKAFEYLKGIKKLDMSYCTQKTITDDAFKNLTRAVEIKMYYCIQFTGQAIKNLITLKNKYVAVTDCRDELYRTARSMTKYLID